MKLWAEVPCISCCNNNNFICLGDTSDCTTPDVESFRCWSCGFKQFLDQSFEYRYVYGDDVSLERALELSFCEWGRRSPTDPYRICE